MYTYFYTKLSELGIRVRHFIMACKLGLCERFFFNTGIRILIKCIVSHSVETKFGIKRKTKLRMLWSSQWGTSFHGGTDLEACVLTGALCRRGAAYPRCCSFSHGTSHHITHENTKLHFIHV